MHTVASLCLEVLGHSREYERSAALLGCFYRLCYHCLVRLFVTQRISLRVDGVLFSVVFVYVIEEVVYLVRLNVARAATLISRGVRELTDNGKGLLFFKGQYLALIFEKHHTLVAKAGCDKVVCIEIGGGGVLVYGELVHYGKYTLYSRIEHRLVKLARLYCIVDLAVSLTVRTLTGHFKIRAGLQGEHSVTHCVPVTHNKSIEAPIAAQDVGEQPL